MQTRTRNPYQVRPFVEKGQRPELEVFDTRDDVGVKWFPATAAGAEQAHAYAADLWIAEAVAAAAGFVEHGPDELVDVRDLAADLGRAPVRGPIVPTAGQLDAALLARQEEAERGERLCRQDRDGEGAKIARNSANAYRNARGDLAAAVAAGRELVVATPAGDLLVASASRGSVWHNVRRVPRAGDDYSPIVCSCEHGQAGRLGMCRHVAIFEAYADACATAVAARDDHARSAA